MAYHGHVNQSYVKLPEGIEQENRKTRRIDYVEEHGKAWTGFQWARFLAQPWKPNKKNGPKPVA
jgi:hypothetical protein